MRNLALRLAAIAGVVLTLGACADSPTQSDQQPAPDLAAPAQDEQVAPQGCVVGGVCLLPPISGGWCEPWMELDWDCDEGGGECMTSVGDPTDAEGSIGIQWCPGGGDTGGGGGGYTPPPGGTGPGGEPCIQGATSSCSTICEMDCEATAEDNSICPQPLEGRTLTTLVNVAGRNHAFQFTGTMRRVNPLVGRSPAWYRISGPTASEDTWWIAERGNIQLVCWGRWHFRGSVWLGTVYVNSTDLHMVMGPGHPDF